MKSLILFTTLLAAAMSLAPFLGEKEKPIPNQYIVVLLPNSDLQSHVASMKQNLLLDNSANEIMHMYTIGDFKGYGVRCTDSAILAIRASEEVKYVEQDSYVQAYATQNNPPSWGLDRTSQRNLPLTNTYVYNDNAGAGVEMYTIDTGIYISHNDFGGRATWGITVPSGSSDDDRNGHGTHCSGTMAGSSYGISKQSSLWAVKVLNDFGFGSNNDVIAGVNWVADRYSNGKKIVANMSLGGGASTALDSAVNAAVDKGCHFVTAAGNDNANSCNYSPGRAANAINVCSTDSSDRKSSFSNWGTCVDVCAPGSSITSAWIGSSNASRTISGTSMAAPHVAGVVALWLGYQNLTPSQMMNQIQSESTKNVISGLPSGTPNYLLYNDPPSN